MKTLQEITPDWDVPNHVYFVNDTKDKMYGYVRNKDGKVDKFSKPLPFSTTRRKFKEITNTFNFVIESELEVEEPKGIQYRVPGSKGAIYTVTNDKGAWSCSCPAAKWQKGDCKHVKEIKLNAQ